MLRTTFRAQSGEGVQVIQPARPLAIRWIDLAGVPEREQIRRLEEIARSEAAAPFDLARDPMLRCTLVKCGEEQHALLLSMHHIASDGWSMNVLAREFAALYAAARDGEPDPLPPLPVQYADYARWQRAGLPGERLERELAYWRQALAGIPPVHALPLDHPRPARQAFSGAQVVRHLNAASLDQLHRLAQRHDASLFMVLESLLAVLLARWSNENEVVIGTPVAGRTQKELEPLIGFFVNSLVLRHDLSSDPSFDEVLARTRRLALDAYAHQAIPFEMLVEELRPERTLSHTPLYQVSFTFHNNEKVELELPGLEITALGSEGLLARYDLEIHMAEGPEGLHIRWVYADSLFSASTIERLAGSFAVLVDAVLASPRTPVHELPLLPAEDRARLAEWNQTQRAFPQDRCAHELFERHVREAPDATAVVFEGERLSYRELNREANRVAHYLRSQGVGPEARVGLCVERSPEMVVGILGILKAGGAYVPLDPHYPEERLAYMLEDSGVETVLTQRAVLEALPLLAERTVLPLDREIREALLSGCADTDLDRSALGLGPSHLCYMVYTSGSTGQPKGVLLEHAGLVNLAECQRALFDIDAGSRVLQFSSLSFDASTWDWLLALASGASLHVCPQEVRLSAERLGDYLVSHGITHALIPPAMLAHLDAERAYPLRVLIVGGEACDDRLAWRWARSCRVVNAYGPSENTVVASCADVTPSQPVTLGRPLPNCTLHVLNRRLSPAPIGVPGELAVGGVQLARGYLNRPSLTGERFVTVAVGEEPPQRLYRTGDLVRRLPGGDLQFLGRIDDQVKLRGFRIE
ncbi:MAG TPA: amino acid adenylation domain-containing protein, partial [Vicinamibacteria bacterium]